MAFDAFSSLGVPAYNTDASTDPSGYGNTNTTNKRNVLVVAIIVILAVALLVMGVIGLRVSGEIVI